MITETSQADETPGSPAPAGTNRRTVLLGVGAVGTAAVLAACGSNSDTAAGTPAGTSPTTGAAMTPGASGGASAAKLDLGPDTAIPVGGGKIFADQLVVVTQPTAGAFKAFTAVCTHNQCTVSSVANGDIICLCHGSRYSIADGSVVQGPATLALAAKTVTITKGEVIVG